MLKDVNVVVQKDLEECIQTQTPRFGLSYSLHIYLSHKLEFPGEKTLFHVYVFVML